MPDRDPIERPFALVVALVAFGAWLGGDFFMHEVLSEIAILSIFAMSLALLVGQVGMVSMGHAAFFATGAYATAAFTIHLGWPVFAVLPAAIVVAALLATLTGIFAIRTGGVFFIMITLAIGQMVHAYLFKARAFGADDGMGGIPRMDLAWMGFDSNSPEVFSASVLIIAAMVWFLLRVLVRSPYGAMLLAIHHNEHRLRALGGFIFRYKLAAFVIAGAVAGLAGSLTAQHTAFVSPDLGFWTVSGEVLIMVIVGGMGSLTGAIAGAAVLTLLRHTLSDSSFWQNLGLDSGLASYWQFMMGVFFIIMVVFATDGIHGRLQRLWRSVKGSTKG
ncbi:MAG: branched-chain amino acid ABC transporter permease [Ectothiorhodospiraceae bacterium AqS1]|nr:branched-chain amino acid ABC transporter permease [Ectothiorhodospiraceae bacterium AqS1]